MPNCFIRRRMLRWMAADPMEAGSKPIVSLSIDSISRMGQLGWFCEEELARLAGEEMFFMNPLDGAFGVEQNRAQIGGRRDLDSGVHEILGLAPECLGGPFGDES